MDLAPTAQGLVFLTAYLGSSLAETAGQHMAIIRNDAKVAELAQVLAQLYCETPQPFDDPRFEAAYKAAIGSVLERLPEALKSAPLIHVARAGASRLRVFQVDAAANGPGAAGSSRPQVTELAPLGVNWQASIFYPDNVLTFGETHFTSPWVIQPRGYPGNPVDWFTFLSEVENIYDTFPPSLDSVRTMTSDQIVPRIGDESFTFIASSSYTQYVDWFGFAFGQFWDAFMEMLAEAFSVTGAASPDGNLRLAPDKGGVYVVRVFSGAVHRANAAEHDLIPRLEDGQFHADIAFWTNALLAGVDLASTFLGVKDLGGDRMARKIAQKATKLAFKRAAKKGPTAPFEWAGIFAAAYDMAKDIATVVVGDEAGIAVKTSAKTVLKAIPRSIDPFFKLSVGAAAVERLLSLDGRHPAFDITPLETWVIVVGDPFTPAMEGIQPDPAAPGTEVTLTGRDFDYRKAQNNEVRLGAMWETATAAEVTQVSTDGKTLTFRLPDDQPQA